MNVELNGIPLAWIHYFKMNDPPQTNILTINELHLKIMKLI